MGIAGGGGKLPGVCARVCGYYVCGGRCAEPPVLVPEGVCLAVPESEAPRPDESWDMGPVQIWRGGGEDESGHCDEEQHGWVGGGTGSNSPLLQYLQPTNMTQNGASRELRIA